MKFKIVLFTLFLCLSSCKKDDELLNLSNSEIQLKWNKAYSDDSIEKSIIGLKWALSYLGATLPSENNGIHISNNIITLNVSRAGFSKIAIEQLNILHKKMMDSEEYQKTKCIDLGRYVSLLLGSSEHYYQITNVPKTLKKLLESYQIEDKKGYINNSKVSYQHRIISFSKQKGMNQLYLSTETDAKTGEIHEYESIEIMSNGQLRFAVYDTKGNLINSADKENTNAGKPAKCIWCHESNFNPLFSEQTDVKGYLTASVFEKKLQEDITSHQKLKNQLTDGVVYSQKQEHTLTELLYITFMEPSAKRLSLEWNLPLEKVEKMLSHLPTHTYEEFPFLGKLYHRKDVDNLAPFKTLKVSGSVREASETEVNYLKK